jgi:multidrug efflux pump subunit AcrB
VPWRFFNAPEQGSVTGNFAMLPTATRADTAEMLAELQRAVGEVAAAYEAEHGLNPVAYALAEIGGNAGRALAGADTKDPAQLGAIAIELIPPDQRPYSSFEFVARLQEAVRAHPLLEELSFRGWRSGPGGDALSVDLSGAEAPVLKAAAEALKTALAAFPEVSALEDSLSWDKEELILTLTPRGEALGFTIGAVGQALRERLSGIEATTYPVGPRSARIRVELPAAEFTADFLDRALMRAPSGAWVPLADIARVERQAGFSTVRRENGLRLVTVRGDISEDDPARAAAITAELRDAILPRIESDFGVSARPSGLAEDERAFLSDALVGFLLCLLGIYLVLAWVFASWSRPAVVMAVIPFGLVGAIWGHWVSDVPLSMFSVVGLIGLAGIIINDSIVLVRTADDYRRTRALAPAIIAAAADRLRPVLLTTLTTVVGLAPLLFERSQDALFLKPTVITLVYGLGFGMALVLLVVPALLAAQADIGRAAAALRRAVGARRRAGPAGAAVALAGAAMAVWFAATLGWHAATGAPPEPVAAALPRAGGPGATLALFLAGAAAVAALAWALGALVLRAGRRRARG